MPIPPADPQQKIDEAPDGRLEIFLGAAPGVGKTYKMLRAAQAKRQNGVDVVIGLIETRGRQDTEEHLRGFEVIPPNRSNTKAMCLGRWMSRLFCNGSPGVDRTRCIGGACRRGILKGEVPGSARSTSYPNRPARQ
jgi:hypothetical protein